MLRLPARATYAMLALVRLAQAPGQRATVAALASAHDLPAPFLLTIMGQLRAAGIVASERGRHGGYVLARDPDSITLIEILDLLETAADRPVPGADRRPAQRALISAVDASVRTSLQQITVASLVASGEVLEAG
ncbi:MAG TPA: Rrf2 family transcriptional regulator [Mycobacteriales bacterium]|nr:Rrf2 family transcriptional regulator [Mycobacteriales bacterium]